MGFFFDDPAALFSPQDDEDLEIYSRVASGSAHRGEPVDELKAVAFNTFAPPPVSSWRRSHDNDVSMTVDRAREESTEQAQNEIDFIRKRVRELLNLGEKEPLSLLALTEHFFGERSRLYRCFADEIKSMDGQHSVFLRCVGTFFLSCAVNMTLDEMNEEDMFAKCLADPDECGLFWRQMHEADDKVRGGDNSNRGGLPFWRNVESAVNTVLRELFIDGRTGHVKVCIDDDKVHCAVLRAMLPFEPEAVQHVRDNRRGFVIDTAACTATGVPVGVSAQGHADSASTSTRRLLQKQFAAADGGTNSSTLTNIGFDFDRGFAAHLLAADIVSLGGSIESSTCARNECWPVTCDQHLKEGDGVLH